MRNVNVNSIGEYIREQREQAKISMRQLARSSGVSNPYLSQIERGLQRIQWLWRSTASIR